MCLTESYDGFLRFFFEALLGLFWGCLDQFVVVNKDTRELEKRKEKKSKEKKQNQNKTKNVVTESRPSLDDDESLRVANQETAR